MAEQAGGVDFFHAEFFAFPRQDQGTNLQKAKISGTRVGGGHAYSELDRLVSPVATPLSEGHWMGWRKSGATAFLNGLEHQVADHLTADTTGIGAPGHDLAIVGIKCSDPVKTVNVRAWPIYG